MFYKSILLFFIVVYTPPFNCYEKNHPTLEGFCSIIPSGWECDIIKDNFDVNDIPKNAENPIAIIKYKYLNKEFTVYNNKKSNPSLTLDFYTIDKKNELIEFIRSQQMYSWCIPIYYGETKDFFIITSPCLNNTRKFSDDANTIISNLHSALESIIVKNDY